MNTTTTETEERQRILDEYKRLNEKIRANSFYDPPFVLDYFPFISAKTAEKISEEGREVVKKMQDEIQAFVTELREKHGIHIDWHDF